MPLFFVLFFVFFKSQSAVPKPAFYSLVHSDIVRGGVRKAKHPADNPAAVQAPTQVAHLPPSPSMLHFHRALRDQGFPLGGHEDGAEADLFDLHLAVSLGEERRRARRYSPVSDKGVRARVFCYLVVLGPLEPGALLWVSVSVVAVSRVPLGGHVAPPLSCGADLRPGGRLIRPPLSRADHAQVLRMLAVIHPPAVVFAFLQGLFRTVAANVVHPYRT